jgi:hypothetical protein
VFAFCTRTWETIPPPRRVRISPELAAIRGTFVLAGGSSRREAGQLEPDRSVEAYDPRSREGSNIVEDVPIPPRDIRIFAMRGRLLLVSLSQDEPRELRFELLEPATAAEKPPAR